MVKSKIQNATPAAESVPPPKALLIELKGKLAGDDEDEKSAPPSVEIFAALSMEEVLAYVRGRQPSIEILELRVLGKVQVLSSSENLEWGLNPGAISALPMFIKRKRG